MREKRETGRQEKWRESHRKRETEIKSHNARKEDLLKYWQRPRGKCLFEQKLATLVTPGVCWERDP